MKVTLRRFLEITGTEIIATYLCAVYVDEYDSLFEQYFPKRVKFKNGYDCIRNIDDLEPYMDYEIYSFDQEFRWGELENQFIYLREME